MQSKPVKINPNSDVLLLLNKVIKNYEPYKKLIDAGLTWEDFIDQKIPNEDFVKVDSGFQLILREESKIYLQAAKQILGAAENTNHILYDAHSIMKWHTNSDMVGQRIYYTYTEGKAAFMYMNGNERIIDYDDIGWTCRTFYLTGPEDPLWHTIYTEKERYSFGFWLK